MIGAKDMALLPIEDAAPPAPIAPAAADAGLVGMFERLARDPSVDVEKLERIIALQERIMRHNAKAAFDAAFSRMQADMPEVTERGQIAVKGVVRSTYAKLEDIHEAIKPVLKQFGFAVRHRTEWPEDRKGIIRIVGVLSHEQGHSEESVFEAPMDRSDFRTDIQSMGSTVSYGRRYTTLDLLNIATRNQDDDGRSHGRKPEPDTAEPDGYATFLAGLETVSTEGTAALMECFNKSSLPLRTYLTTKQGATWNALKSVAASVKAVRR